MRVEIFDMAKLFLLPDAPDNPPFEIIETMLLIGRKPDNTLQVEDTNVSKYHALLVKTEEGYRLFDLHSANGTYLNDNRVTVAVIKHNDHIRVGPATFRFEFETAPAAAPQPAAKPKIQFHGKLGAKPLGLKPASPSVATVVDARPVAAEVTVLDAHPPTAATLPPPSSGPAPIPVATPLLIPESKAPPAPPVVTAQPPSNIAVPVAEVSAPSTPPSAPPPPPAGAEPRGFIKIPAGKKADIEPAKTSPPVPKPATPPPPTPAAATPSSAPSFVPDSAAPPVPPTPPAAVPTPPPSPEPPAPTPPAPAANVPIGGPKPPTGERSLRPKLGGAGGGGERVLKLKK